MKKTGKIIVDVIEKYIPCGCFTAMFLAFLINIVMRYIFKNPQSWTFEFSEIMFIWMAFLGACYVLRDQQHISFTMVYDALSPKSQTIFRIITDVIIIGIIGFATKPVFDYVVKMGMKKSSTLHISYTVLFFPYVVMYADTVIRYIIFLVKDIRSFRESASGQPVKGGEK